ncbi:unnamed protein product [Mytilus edulis]|uniref:Uncharacterized protein n=1 Tax=Mytilus edulis TaxID=6550 RepID=A0A8S3TYP7_MYTED|nr:unnamed protein product [Mytilus edulis]
MYCDNPYLDEKTLSKAELRQNSKYNTLHHHSYRDVLQYFDEKTLYLDDEKTLSKAELRQNSKYNTLHHHSYMRSTVAYLDDSVQKLNLDKTANIIPNTIIPIETYCDNPYLDEKTLSKAELRQNSKYNTLHHHSYRDVFNPYLDEKTWSKAELRQNSKYNTKHHHSYRDVTDNPYLDEKTVQS